MFGSNFTSMIANWNTVFRGHRDGNNSLGALSCLVAFGSHIGGGLAFPRLGVLIDAGERDLVVCNCPAEMHGTMTPLVGTRYSIVCYTREGLTSSGLR